MRHQRPTAPAQTPYSITSDGNVHFTRKKDASRQASEFLQRQPAMMYTWQNHVQSTYLRIKLAFNLHSLLSLKTTEQNYCQHYILTQALTNSQKLLIRHDEYTATILTL